MPKHATADQLRHSIDTGQTGDKVAVLDPAAAPLGTDEEAAGTPTPGEAIEQAREYERTMGLIALDGARPAGGTSMLRLYAMIILALVGLVLVSVWLAHRA